MFEISAFVDLELVIVVLLVVVLQVVDVHLLDFIHFLTLLPTDLHILDSVGRHVVYILLQDVVEVLVVQFPGVFFDLLLPVDVNRPENLDVLRVLDERSARELARREFYEVIDSEVLVIGRGDQSFEFHGVGEGNDVVVFLFSDCLVLHLDLVVDQFLLDLLVAHVWQVYEDHSEETEL